MGITTKETEINNCLDIIIDAYNKHSMKKITDAEMELLMPAHNAIHKLFYLLKQPGKMSSELINLIKKVLQLLWKL